MKTTKRHFELFKKQCEETLEYLGLKQWEVIYKHKKIEEDGEKPYDTCSPDINTFTATITLNTLWGEPNELSDAEIRLTAKHEVLHILLARLVQLGHWRWANKAEMDSAEEEIVRLLSKLV